MDNAWQLFIAEGVRLISENTAKNVGGSYLTAKWADIVDPKPADTRTPEQIVDHVLTRLKEVG